MASLNSEAPLSADIRKPQNSNLLDYLFFLRPTLHPPAWTVVILGFFSGPASTVSYANLYWLLLLSSGAAGWAYIVNQIADIETDRANGKLYFLPDGLIPLNAAYILAGLVFAATLTGAFLLGSVFGLLFLSGLVMGYLYSGPPFYGKNRPVVGTLLNGLAYGMMPYIAGFAGAGGEIGEGLLKSIPYLFAVAAVSVGTTLPDIAGDSKIGKITPGVAMGLRRSILLMNALVMASIILSLFTRDLFLLAAAGASLPIYLYAAYRPQTHLAVMAIKISILALSLAACWRFWPYAFILLGLLVLTRLYYRLRFGMTYPRLT